MEVKSKKEKNLKLKHEAYQILIQYRQEINQTFEFLRDSKDYLEYKRISKKVSNKIYLVRFSSFMNIAVVYFYSLYEAFTRNFFCALMRYDKDISSQDFKDLYPQFHDVINKVVKKIYQFYLSKDLYNSINHLRLARNQIIHLGENAKLKFEIIEKCYKLLTKYFDLIESEFF